MQPRPRLSRLHTPHRRTEVRFEFQTWEVVTFGPPLQPPPGSQGVQREASRLVLSWERMRVQESLARIHLLDIRHHM